MFVTRRIPGAPSPSSHAQVAHTAPIAPVPTTQYLITKFRTIFPNKGLRHAPPNSRKAKPSLLLVIPFRTEPNRTFSTSCNRLGPDFPGSKVPAGR